MHVLIFIGQYLKLKNLKLQWVCSRRFLISSSANSDNLFPCQPRLVALDLNLTVIDNLFIIEDSFRH